MKDVKLILTIAITILTLYSCRNNKDDDMQARVNSVYYWRTSFYLSDGERKFIRDYDIHNLYVRYFDVTPNEDSTLMPNATITFDGYPMPQSVNIIPVIYILNECMKYNINDLGVKIVKRIMQINATNNIHHVKEIQIDCDWTMRSQKQYFALLRDIRQYNAKHGIRLSATIRLHQLSQTPPPVDNGTLMVYNTGDVKDIHCLNPILQLKDVSPYLKYIADYPLKMNAAYPIFRWKLLYRNSHFVGFMHGDNIETYPGDSIIERQCPAEEILKVRDAISKENKEINRSVIIYTLDNNNIKRYNKDDIKKIYNR